MFIAYWTLLQSTDHNRYDGNDEICIHFTFNYYLTMVISFSLK